MTPTATEQRISAVINFERFKSRLSKSKISGELSKVDGFLTKELRISKDLRNIEYISTYLSLRHYYKHLLTLIG